jgi:hypothetical protein
MSQKAPADMPDGVGAAAGGSSSTGVGAAAGGSSSTAAGSSSAARGLVANVFGGQRGHEGYASSQEDLFKKIDKVVYPGHGDPDTMQDPKSTSERFAQCAVGTPVASGFTRVSAMRKVSGVKREYDCLQEYQCVTCQRNLASNLALRPPTENMRVFVPGPQLPASASKSTCEAVFREEHAEQLKRAGYLQLDVRFHAPDMELQGFDPLQTSTPCRKRPARESVSAAPENTHDASDTKVLTELSMPDKVPTWKSYNDLIAMMERPFRLHDASGNLRGPYTPIYMWPSNSSKRQCFGAYWKESRSMDAMSNIYKDYYNIRVRPDDSRKVLLATKPDLFLDGNDPLRGDVRDGVVSTLRSSASLTRPAKVGTWAQCVLAHLESSLGDAYKPPFT